jgi:hypothetical protein
MQRKATIDATSSGSPILPMGSRAISFFTSSGSIVFWKNKSPHQVIYNHVIKRF